jgi:hypothetical protein
LSSYYRYQLFCTLRTDAPPILHRALTAAAARAPLSMSEMADLPPIVADYLAYESVMGEGVQVYAPQGPGRVVDGQVVIDMASPHTHYVFAMVRTFHDDEYWNGGVYLPYWLMQFIADDGPIGTRQQTNGNEPPAILTRVGGDIIVSNTAYAPARFWPMPGAAAPDGEAPLVFESHDRFNLAKRLQDLAMFADGWPG